MLLNSIPLNKHLNGLREHFLPAKKVNELAQPDNFEQDLDARAYLILAHSAFEQFFEDTARDFSKFAIERWLLGLTPTNQQIVTLCCLTASQGDLNKSLNSDAGSEESYSELKNFKNLITEISPRTSVKNSLQEGKKKFDALLEKNHGADLHYLQLIFPSIGVYIDLTPDAQSALSQIANARGTFAHRHTPTRRGKFAYKPIAADAALSNVNTLLIWCKDFENRLRASLKPNYKILMDNAKQELLNELVNAIKFLSSTRIPT